MNKNVTCRDIHGDPYEIPSSELTFRPSIYGVVIKDGKVLLHSYEDGYDFPGGGVDLGEGLDEAFGREIKEETGLRVTRGEPLKVLSDLFIHPGTKRPYHTILLYFVGIDPQGEISTEYFDEHEKAVASAAVWVDIDTVSSLKFFNPMSPQENQELVRKAASLAVMRTNPQG